MPGGAEGLKRGFASVSDATVAGPEEAVPVAGRVSTEVEGQTPGELLSRAERDEVEGEARAADAAALGKTGVATAHRAWRPVEVA